MPYKDIEKRRACDREVRKRIYHKRDEQGLCPHCGAHGEGGWCVSCVTVSNDGTIRGFTYAVNI